MIGGFRREVYGVTDLNAAAYPSAVVGVMRNGVLDDLVEKNICKRLGVR